MVRTFDTVTFIRLPPTIPQMSAQSGSLGCFLVDLPEDWSFGIVEVSKNEEILL